MRGLLSALLLALSAGAAASACPAGCVCSHNLIVCACRQSTGNLTLQPFHQIEYIAKIFVHSCAAVHVPNDTFAGLSIGQELVMTGIGRLTFESFAFREMMSYPSQLRFRDVGIPEIPALTFAGLNTAEHLWFRNATIGVIRGNAFARVSSLKYLYFRETKIGKIEAGAFAVMNKIGHIFIRGGVRIDSIEDHLFLGSSVLQKVIIEDADITSISYAAFAGAAYLHLLRIENCTIRGTTYAQPRIPFTASVGGSRVEVIETNWRTLSLGAFSNVRSVELRLVVAEELLLSAQPLRNVSALTFSHCLINFLSDHAFADADNIGTLAFRHSAINTIFPKAFKKADIGSLVFTDTRVTRIQEGAFSELRVGSLTFAAARLETVAGLAFARIRAASLRFEGSAIGELRPRAFQEAEAAYFGLEGCELGNLSALALEGLQPGLLNVSANEIRAYAPLSFAGVYGGRKLVARNTFPCRCDRTYQQLQAMLGEAKFGEEWSFGGAFCRTQPGNGSVALGRFLGACSQESQRPARRNYGSNLACEQKGLLLACSCNNLDELHLDKGTVKRWDESMSALLLENCERVSLGSGWLSPLPHLSSVTIAVRRLHLAPGAFRGMPNLRRVVIERAEMPLLPSHSFKGLAGLESLEFRNIQIKSLERQAFAGVVVTTLLFHRAQIGRVATAFLDPDSGTRVANLTISQSRIGRLETGAVLGGSVAAVEISRSELSLLEVGVFGSRRGGLRLCLSENRVRCSCDSARGLASLQSVAGAHCEGTRNECLHHALSPGEFLRRHSDWAQRGCEAEERSPSLPITSGGRALLAPLPALLSLLLLRVAYCRAYETP